MKSIVAVFCVTLIFIFTSWQCSSSSEPDPEPANNPPVISSMSTNPDSVEVNETCELTCIASDIDNDNLNYIWQVQAGSINGTGSSVTWIAPDSVGMYSVTCKVEDGNGGEDVDSVNIVVEQPLPVQGLIAYYPFNGNANDESGNGNNGTVIGATLTTDRFGKSNNSYLFSGNGDKINTNFSPSLIFSISVWYNKTQNQKENAGLFSTYSGGFNYSGVYFAMNGNYDWIRCDGNSLDSFSSPPLIWKHIVIISDGTKVKVYVNANKILDFNGTTNHSNSLVIGDSRYNGRYFTGTIDDIRVYNRTLAEEEIQLLYNEGGWIN